MTSPGFVQLDTNILVHLIRASLVGRNVNDQLSLSSRGDRPIISVITVGEIRALARKSGWGATKMESLNQLVRQMVIVHFHQGEIIQKYAELITSPFTTLSRTNSCRRAYRRYYRGLISFKTICAQDCPLNGIAVVW